MASPTKSFAELQVTKRKRRDTISLLPSSYDPDTDVMPEPPIPEASPSLYTRERLQQSLAYAERFLKRRDISPRSELFMHIYKVELKDALKAETTEQRENHAMTVMAEERIIQDNMFLRPLKSAHNAELEDKLLQLREFQYLIRYGDYMKIVPTRLRLHASKHKSKNWQLISGKNYWSRIAMTIGAEEEARKEAVRVGAALGQVKLPTTAAVYMACADLGISEDIALWSIEEYGTRNREVHRNLNDLKREGEFPLLASILCADRNDLSSTFSLIKSETDITHLRMIIQSEIDTWFEDTSDNPNHPAAWVPSTALRKFYKDAVQKANQLSKEAIKQTNITRSQRKSKEKVARREAGSTGTSSLAGKNRVASTEEPWGSEWERQERTRQQRFKALAQKCKLEDNLKRINCKLALLDDNNVSLDEQASEDYIP